MGEAGRPTEDPLLYLVRVGEQQHGFARLRHEKSPPRDTERHRESADEFSCMRTKPRASQALCLLETKPALPDSPLL